MDDGIIILKKTEPYMCGGTDATLDTNAPHEIVSDEILYFFAGSAIGVSIGNEPTAFQKFNAYAARCDAGTLLYLEVSQGWHSAPETSRAVVKDDVMPALAGVVKECDFAKSNGYHSTTHGLPENFGGSVNILYASGEKISFSDNQSPIIAYNSAQKIVNFIKDAMAKEPAALPDADDICELRFSETRDGGYTRAALEILPDGSAINKKESLYEGSPTVYKSEKEVDADTVALIKDAARRCGMFAWSGLPENGFKLFEPKSLTFVFKDGREITVYNDRELPMALGNGFFTIELEVTTKH